MSKILVTGGAGFIGSHIVDHFVKEGHKVTAFDNLSTGKYENINSNAWFFKGDIRNMDDLNAVMNEVEYVFHEAALVSVPKSIEDPDLCHQINVEGTRNVLESALKNKVKKVVIASSAAVYGDSNNLPLKEDEILKPMSPYADSKLVNEELGREFTKKGLEVVSLRYFNVTGERQDPSSPYSGVISIFEDRAIKNIDIIIYGDGEQTRDFIEVKDIVKANVLAIEKLPPGEYNVASGKEITINEIAKKIIQSKKSKSKIIYSDTRKGDIKRSLADISKIKEFESRRK
ncbi:hypothetical protein BVX95_00735 [archaeon D22]|nr:hypothetical protein BVX95_00735 [archaeon D22]